jgi:hypothetical protein
MHRVPTDPVDVDELLKRAHELTHGERHNTYGPPHRDYQRVAAIYNAIRGAAMTSADAALFMIAVKLARIGHNHKNELMHLDSIVDAAGYLWVYAQCAQDLDHDVIQ